MNKYNIPDEDKKVLSDFAATMHYGAVQSNYSLFVKRILFDAYSKALIEMNKTIPDVVQAHMRRVKKQEVVPKNVYN